MSKIAQRRLKFRLEAVKCLEELVTRKGDPYEPYMRLFMLWCSNNSALQALRPLFRMEGANADGSFSMTPEFRERIYSVAAEILATFPTDAARPKQTQNRSSKGSGVDSA